MNTRALWNRCQSHTSFILMLVFLFILAVHEVFESVWIADPYALQESDPGIFANFVYLHLASLAFYFHKDAGPPVTIVYIDPATDPPYLLTNTCLARDFIAELVQDITKLGAKAIVIDKFYSDGSCSDSTTNQNFRNVLNSIAERLPVVVGQQTKLSPKADNTQERCLELSNPFDFETSEGAIVKRETSKVHFGLTRLNSDVLKIPLRWPVFKDGRCPKDGLTSAGSAESLSLVAAEQIEPSLKENGSSLQNLSLSQHPYTSFLEIPSTTAMTVRCDVEQKPVDASGNELDCAKARSRNSCECLKGKVVMIGDMSDQDMQPFPDSKLESQSRSQDEPPKDRPGVFLQANYTQSILDQRFLREIPFWFTLIGLVFYIFSVYFLHFFKRSTEYAEFLSLIALLLLILISFIALVTLHYYTPLWAIASAAIFVVFRYFETKAHHYSDQVKGKGSHPEH
jgi:CHASE2 domain-containing sensor protein